jgi:predicted ATPase/class 3 adenylate cyclase
VTFLFTDLEASTRLWEEHPEAMRSALARHDEILRDAVESNRGHVVKATGDGLHAVFSVAGDAVAAAVDGQLGLDAEPWAAGPALRVRIGVHTGAAEERGGDYYGPAVNRAARVAAAGHGGQIIVSHATEELVRDVLPAKVGVVDLGEHRLRDLSRPERIFQLTHQELTADFPPLRSLDRYRTNLATQPNVFVGRDEELAHVDEALRESLLVTLTGVGGVGKTRLALQAAAESLPGFADGAWVVELGSTANANEVDEAAASALGLTATPGQSVRSALLEYLRDRYLLLVLDNCEHLVGPVADLVEAVNATCPHVHVLATSREGLAIAGERLLAVPPLALAVGETLDEVAAADAVRLFVERASGVSESFRLDESNASVIAGLARRLDGIPLALELAAARVRAMAPADILGHLDQRFRLLTGGRRTALSRQQTLRGAVDWSYDLLEEEARVLFRRLGVFVGGFDLAAAEHVGGGAPIAALDVADQIQRLVERSLVQADTSRAPARYRLLETLRDYAVDRLNEASELDDVARRHADYFVSFAQRAGAGLRGPDEVRWSDQLDEELDNVRAAVSWLVGVGDVDAAMEAVMALAEFATRLAAPLGAIATDVAAMDGAREHPLRPVALASAAWHVHQHDGDTAAALRIARDAVDASSPEPTVARCRALAALAGMAGGTGDLERGVPIGRQWLTEAESLGDRWETLQALALIGAIAGATGDEEARIAAERAVALAEELDSPTGRAFSRLALGLALAPRDRSEARDQLEEARRAAVEARNDYAETVVLGVLGGLYTNLGEHELAAAIVYTSAARADAGGHRATSETGTRALAILLARVGQDEGALLLDAWADLHDVPAAWGTPWEDTTALDRLRDAQSKEQRDENTTRAATLDATAILAVARTCIDALGTPAEAFDDHR